MSICIDLFARERTRLPNHASVWATNMRFGSHGAKDLCHL